MDDAGVLFVVMQFLGRLFGAALRTRVLLPLWLPALFWKPFVGAKPTIDDLEAVAVSVVQGVIKYMRSCTSAADFDEKFADYDKSW